MRNLRYVLTVLFFVVACSSQKELTISDLRQSYHMERGVAEPAIYYLNTGTDKMVKVATVKEIVYGSFGPKTLLTYKISLVTTEYTNAEEIVNWILLTQKRVEQVETKYP